MSYHEFIPSKEKVISTIDLTLEIMNKKNVFGYTNMRVFHLTKDGQNKIYYRDLRLDEICGIKNFWQGKRKGSLCCGIYFFFSLVVGIISLLTLGSTLLILRMIIPVMLILLTIAILFIIRGIKEKGIITIYDLDSQWESFTYKKYYKEKIKIFIQTIYYVNLKSQI